MKRRAAIRDKISKPVKVASRVARRRATSIRAVAARVWATKKAARRNRPDVKGGAVHTPRLTRDDPEGTSFVSLDVSEKKNHPQITQITQIRKPLATKRHKEKESRVSWAASRCGLRMELLCFLSLFVADFFFLSA